MRRPGHFVIVDDDERTVFLVVRALKDAFPQFAVRTFSDGTEALTYLLSNETDCLITDQSMTRLNGDQLIAALRAEDVHIPAIMISNSPYAQAAAGSVGVPLIDKGRIATDLGKAVAALLDEARLAG